MVVTDRAGNVRRSPPMAAIQGSPRTSSLICAFTFNNVHMMLISGIGRPYDPKTR
jgi:hypothetical protein